MKDCSSTSVVPPSAFRTTVRKESTTTTPGLAFSTSFVISSKTAPRSFSNTTWLKLIKRTAVFSGFGLLERTEHQYPDMPVVMVTGVHDVSVALSAIRNGAFDYLMKPFEREQLVAVVRRALDDRRMKLERRAFVSSLESQVATLTEQLRGRTS
jgi:DNA-binding NtrC family response regulator